jgi:hypothetical protein
LLRLRRGHERECALALAAGKAIEVHAEFCPNADTLSAVVKKTALNAGPNVKSAPLSSPSSDHGTDRNPT